MFLALTSVDGLNSRIVLKNKKPKTLHWSEKRVTSRYFSKVNLNTGNVVLTKCWKGLMGRESPLLPPLPTLLIAASHTHQPN